MGFSIPISAVNCPYMATRTPAPKARGERARMAILRELRRRELALEPTPSGNELEVALGMTHDQLRGGA